MNGIRHSPSFPVVPVLLGGSAARASQRPTPSTLHPTHGIKYYNISSIYLHILNKPQVLADI
jgi:hypothetical protein